MSNFHVGQKVVCIGAVPGIRAILSSEKSCKRGGVYTVRDIITANEIVGIRLVEIVNEPRQYSAGFMEMAYVAAAFRPLVTKSTEAGMSILRSLLEPQPEKTDA